MSNQGMIFAAGLGTRLAPITDTKPKALVEVGGRPLLDHAIRHYCRFGITDIVVNVHHFADQIIDYIERNRANWPADIAISDEREQILDTAGGLAKALPLFGADRPIFVSNADVMSNAPLEEMLMAHIRSGADATLMTSSRHSTRNLLFDIEGRLTGWRNSQTGEERIVRDVAAPTSEAFNGYHIINHRLAQEFLPVRPQPIIPAYLGLADRYVISRYHIGVDRYWFDVGTPAKLEQAEAFAQNHPEILR